MYYPSPYHDLFADILKEEEGIEVQITLSLLSVIQAHDNLLLFDAVSQNLCDILPILTKIDPISWPQAKIDKWVQVSHAAHYHQSRISQNILEFTKRRREIQNPIRGIIGPNPLYAAIWYKPPFSTESNKAFLHLQAHLINSFSAFSELTKKGKKYGAISEYASLCIRKFVTNDNLHQLLKRLPCDARSEEQFQTITVDLLTDTSLTDSERDEIVVLERLLSFALGQRGGNTRGSQEKFSPDPIITTENLDPDSELTLKPQKHIRTSNLTKSKAKKARIAGWAPSEQHQGPRFTQGGDETKTDRGGSIRQQANKAHNKNRYIATNNQLFSLRWENLNLHDVTQLLHSLGDILRDQRSRKTRAKEVHIELVALICIMYWTSSPFERAKATRITHSLETLPKNIKEGEIYFCHQDEVWVIGTPEPEQRRKAEPSWSNYLRPNQKMVFLPCHPHAVTMMEPWLQKQSININSRSKPLFTTSNDDLYDLLTKFIATINKQHNTRITSHRISAHLAQVISDHTFDFADAALITSRTPPSGQLSTLYYYTPEINFLAHTYQDACHNVVSAVYQALNKAPPKKPPKIEFPKAFVGSEICPLEQTVSLLAKDLKAKVAHTRKERFATNALIDFHNAYTSYSTIMLSFATGYRVVKDPFYSVSDIDQETGFVVITDKDNDDYYNTRLAWLPSICLNQVKAYSKHRDALAERLVLLNLSTAKRLNPPCVSAWPSRRPKQQNAAPFLFYLDESAAIVPISEESLQDHVEWSYEIALNAHRHYLRTQLREKKVSGEIVNAFMGHWDRGQEPFGCYSSLSPMAYRSEITGPLTQLTTTAGWELLKGLT